MRPLILFMGAALMATSSGLCAAERPNVLFVVCDDLNRHVGPAGNQQVRTPALQKLAAAGLTLRRAYCQYPVCGPSRASFLSGLYPESSGVLDNKSDIRTKRPGVTSLPQLFKDQGYWTGGVGKVFHNPNTNPGDVAWHEFEMFKNDESPVEARLRQEFEKQHGPITERRNQSAWRRKLRENRRAISGQTPPGYGPTQLRDEQHKDGKNVRQVAQWLDEQAYGKQPFFITCGIQKPHVPFWAPQKYFDQYPLHEIQYRATPADDWKHRPPLAISKRYLAFGFELGRENDRLRRRYTQAYHACITFIDAQIGLLLDALKRNGHWEDTIIVFTSDHGYHLGEHSLWGKVTLFEECARVPMIVRFPKHTRGGSQTDALVELVDLYPTLVELCGIKPVHSLQGKSFAALLDNPQSPGKKAAYTVVSRGKKLGRAIRTRRWRYAEWGHPDQAELYDLEADPLEDHNLVEDPQYRAQRQLLHDLLRATRKQAAGTLAVDR